MILSEVLKPADSPVRIRAGMPGIDSPQVALGLTRGGIIDAPTDSPVEAVFLFLFPDDGEASSVRLLAAAGRIMRSADLRKLLGEARTAEEALEVISRPS